MSSFDFIGGGEAAEETEEKQTEEETAEAEGAPPLPICQRISAPSLGS